MDPLIMLAHTFIQLDESYEALPESLEILHQQLAGWFYAQASTPDMTAMRDAYERATARWKEAHAQDEQDTAAWVSPIDILLGRDKKGAE